MEIAGHVVVVSGGASGMGAATAQHLASLGANVAILDNHPEAAKVIADEIGAYAITCDVSDESQVQAAMDAVIGNISAPPAPGISFPGSPYLSIFPDTSHTTAWVQT